MIRWPFLRAKPSLQGSTSCNDSEVWPVGRQQLDNTRRLTFSKAVCFLCVYSRPKHNAVHIMLCMCVHVRNTSRR